MRKRRTQRIRRKNKAEAFQTHHPPTFLHCPDHFAPVFLSLYTPFSHRHSLSFLYIFCTRAIAAHLVICTQSAHGVFPPPFPTPTLLNGNRPFAAPCTDVRARLTLAYGGFSYLFLTQHFVVFQPRCCCIRPSFQPHGRVHASKATSLKAGTERPAFLRHMRTHRS